MSLSESASGGISLKEDSKSGQSLSSSNDINVEKTNSLSIKGNNKSISMTLRSGKKEKEHPSTYDHMCADKVMEGEPDKGQSLELKKRHPGKSQQPNEDSDAEVEPDSPAARYRVTERSDSKATPRLRT